MFRVQGVSPPPLLIYRFAVFILLVLLLFSYHSHHSQLDSVIQTARDELESCHANSESIFSKLKVIFEHKKKMEWMAQLARNDSDRRIGDMRKSLVGCHGELDLAKKRLTTVEQPTLRSTTMSSDRQQMLHELSRLRLEIEKFRVSSEKEKKASEKASKALGEAKRELEECCLTIRQHVGAMPISHYTQNETASFQRKHKVGEALSFDRGQIEEHHGQVMAGAELARRLKERKGGGKAEEKEIHPDDRGKDDAYVNDVADADEKDYKEQPGGR